MEDELGAPGARPEEEVIRTMRDIVEYLVAVSDPLQVNGRRTHVLGWTYERGGNGWRRRKRKKKWAKRGILILAEDHQRAKLACYFRVQNKQDRVQNKQVQVQNKQVQVQNNPDRG